MRGGWGRGLGVAVGGVGFFRWGNGRGGGVGWVDVGQSVCWNWSQIAPTQPEWYQSNRIIMPRRARHPSDTRRLVSPRLTTSLPSAAPPAYAAACSSSSPVRSPRRHWPRCLHPRPRPHLRQSRPTARSSRWPCACFPAARTSTRSGFGRWLLRPVGATGAAAGEGRARQGKDERGQRVCVSG